VAAALVAVVLRAARRHGAPLAPDLPGIRAAGHAAVPLLIRTLTLRAALIVTTYAVVVGSATGSAELAAHQLAFTVWTFLAFVLDSIAIAAQALTGRYLGAGDAATTRAVTRRMLGWGVVSGLVTALGLGALAPWLGRLFTTDAAVLDLLVPVLVVAALGQPLAGLVFVLDGVLIGAGDGTYLAWAGLAVLAVYAPAVLVVAATLGSLTGIWATFCVVFMGARAAVLLRRERGEAWLVTGVR
ncbi:MAG TPA: MATE family efflux transporter, partial [Nocardioides sp.]|uniref:MATE family efflux transporter n=1 Tax=Nocardioides sp. TaxID=35761 RepID=UPI002BAB3EAE